MVALTTSEKLALACAPLITVVSAICGNILAVKLGVTLVASAS